MKTPLIGACLILTAAPAAWPSTNARILLVDDLGACLDQVGPCDLLSAEFPVSIFQFEMVLNGVPSVSRIYFGLDRGLSQSLNLRDECGGTIEIVGAGETVVGLDWNASASCSALDGVFKRFGTMGVASQWATEVRIVDHPHLGPPAIVDCNGVTWTIPVEQLGVVGIGMPGYVPCTDELPTPVDAHSWTRVKTRFHRDDGR